MPHRTLSSDSTIRSHLVVLYDAPLAESPTYHWAVLSSRDWLRYQPGWAGTARRRGQVQLYFPYEEVADVFWQIIAGDLGQGVLRRVGSRMRMPNCIWRPRIWRVSTLWTPVPVVCSFLTEYYGAAIRTLEQVSRVVDSLYAKVRPFTMFDYWFVHIDAIQTIKIA